MSPRKSICWAASVALVVAGMVATAPSATAKPKQKAPGKVSSLSVGRVTAHGAVLSWRNPKSKKNRKFTGTVVRVAAGTHAPGSVKSGRGVASPGKARHSVTIGQLKPGTVYTASVFAKGAGKRYSKARSVRLVTAPGNVTGLYAQTTASTIKLVWRTPSRTAVGTIVRYAAGRVPASPSSGLGAPVRGRAGTVTIGKLRFGTYYGISVWSVDRLHHLSSRVSALFATAPPTSGGVSGVVTEQGTGKRLRNADVYLFNSDTDDEYDTYTGSTGAFALTGVKPGHYGLRVYTDDAEGGSSEAGWLTARLNVTIKAGDPVKFSIPLERGAGIEGTVVGADDPATGLDGAGIYAYSDDDYSDYQSEEDGSFSITQISASTTYEICLEDQYREAGSADSDTGYQQTCLDVPGDVTLVPGEVTNLGTTALARGGAVAGTVSFASDPSDTTVYVFDADGEQVGEGYSDPDDPNGAYKAAGLPVGEDLYVCAESEGDAPAECYDGADGVAWDGDADSLDPTELQAVNVTAGNTTKPVDFTLDG